MPLKDLDKLTVVKLRAELIARGLDPKGNKPFLLERLRIAMEQEEQNGVVAPDIKMFASESQIDDTGIEQEAAEMEDEATGEEDQIISDSELLPKDPNGTAGVEKLNNGSHPTSNEVLSQTEEKLDKDDLPATNLDVSSIETSSISAEAMNAEVNTTKSEMVEKSEEVDSKADEIDANVSSTPNDSMIAVYGGKDETYMEESTLEQTADTTIIQSTNIDSESVKSVKDEETAEVKALGDDATNTIEVPNGVEAGNDVQDPADDEIKMESEPVEAEASDATKQESTPKHERKGDRGSKRHRDRSLSPNHVHKKEESPPQEDEPERDPNHVVLDWYNSDLNLVISKTDFASAHPLTDSGFAYMWAGARATYGFTVGKICFEVKITENLSVPQLEESEPNHHVIRVGWSVDATTYNLGEDPMSFGYGGTGKISQNCEFKDYGVVFKLNDVVGAYLDASEDKEAVEISYTVNGESQGVAFTISKEELNNRPLFPHISTKNCKFEVNFGQREEPWFQPLEGYEWASKVPIESRFRGAVAPASRTECEMIMMCGLPGSGKTTWANKFSVDNFERKFNILGTNAFLQKMKVNGLPRRKNYTGRWEVLIEKCTRCLNILLDIAAKRRRNYILDQTNVYPTAQKRKMAYFSGFKRKAVVIVPDEEEAKKRWEKRIEEEGKDIPDSAVMEMKANFKVPTAEDVFSEVEFPELPLEEALKVIEKYSAEAKAAGYGQPAPKRQRQSGSRRSDRDSRRSHGGRDRNRDRSHRSSSSRYRDDRRDDRHRPPPPPPHWRGPPARGGWGNRGPPPPPIRNGPYSPRRGPPPPPGPMRGGWNAAPAERPYPGGRPGRGYDDRRDRPPYSAPPRRDVGPSPWMSSPSMPNAGPQRSSWGSQSWSGGMSGSSAPAYGQPQQPSYGSASYGGSPLYGSSTARPAASGYSSSAGSVRPPPTSYGAAAAPDRSMAASYGGVPVTAGLGRPVGYGTTAPSTYGTTSLPPSRPAGYGTNGSSARPNSYPAATVGSWTQPQQPQQTGYQYAYNPNHSTYSGGK